MDALTPGHWEQTVTAMLATLICYRAALELFQRSRRKMLLHPLITTPMALGLLLAATGGSYESYWQGTALLTALLAPATVALALPLAQVAHTIRHHAGAISVTTIAGAGIAVAMALGVASLLGADDAVLRSIATKSVTTPIALSVSEIIDGMPRLAAACVVITGVVGAALGPGLLARVGVTDHRVIGFTLGLTAHGIGTARAFDISAQAGAFASLGMGLTGLTTAALLPLFF